MMSVLMLVLLFHSIKSFENHIIERGETGCKLDLCRNEGGPLEGCLMFSTPPVGVNLGKREESGSQMVDCKV